MLIANKYEEIYPPELRDLLQVCEGKFTRQHLLAMEIEVLNVRQFEIQAPSAYRFL